jgi:choline dehydrogenase-like flavoprotein
MFHDARQLSAGTQLDCDLCIIGAGAAGITLARWFAGGPLRVMLLESGGRANGAGLAELTGGEQAGWPYLPLAQTRQARFGGTTGWWSGECRPLDADEDLGPRSWLHGAGWPVPATEIARYEAMAAAICGLGAQPFEPAADWLRAVGQTALPLDPRRFATKIFQYSSRLDFAAAFGGELEAAANVQVMLQAPAVEIESDGARIEAVRVAVGAGQEMRVVARQVVLAGGGIENARLLLASRQATPAGLGNAHDQVGRCFMEHLFHDDVAFFEPSGLLPALRYYGRRTTGPSGSFKAVIVPTAATLAQAGLAHHCFKLAIPWKRLPAIAAALRWRESAHRAFWPESGGRLAARMALGAPEAVAAMVRLLREGELGSRARPWPLPVSVVSEQLPNPESRVTLSSHLDPRGQPQARLDWRPTNEDRMGWAKGLAVLATTLAESGLGTLAVPTGEALERGCERMRGGCHHMGTTRMARRPEDGVVDADCQVHGIGNLYIAGSSIFPTGGHANPTLTIVALALRLADHLEGRHSAGRRGRWSHDIEGPESRAKGTNR